MLPGGSYTPNLETEWKKKKKKPSLKRQKRKKPLISICTSVHHLERRSPMKWMAKAHHNVKLIMKTPRLLSSPSWSETFQEVGNDHRRKFTGGALIWHCYLDAWNQKPLWNSEESEEHLSALIKEGLCARFLVPVGSRWSKQYHAFWAHHLMTLMNPAETVSGYLASNAMFCHFKLYVSQSTMLPYRNVSRRLTILCYSKSESPLAQKA